MKRWIAMMVVWVGTLGILGPAHAISEIGNARLGDAEIGFAARLPGNFSFLGGTPDGGIKLVTRNKRWNPISGSGAWGGLIELELRRVDVEFPELLGATRAEFRQHFLEGEGSIWRALQAGHPCVEAYAGQTLGRSSMEPGTAQAIVAWGPGRGIILLGPAYSEIEAAMREILESLELAEGACSWN